MRQGGSCGFEGQRQHGEIAKLPLLQAWSSERRFQECSTQRDCPACHSSRGVLDRYLHQDVEAIREATALIPRLPRPEA
jgi:hypothetical protein